MARITGRLTALDVKRLSALDEETREAAAPGMYPDGAGLYLRVTPRGASWVLRYMLAGKPRYMGLGPLSLYGLADARARALAAKRLRHDGVDPIDAKRQARAAARLAAAKMITFRKAAEDYIKAHSPEWRGAKVKALWESRLKTYAYPHFGTMPVGVVDTTLILKALRQPQADRKGEPLWTAKAETARKLRQHLEAILDAAKAAGYREGDNPARWDGHLDTQLASGRARRVEHHAALPYLEIGDFMAKLRELDGTAARALEFTVLTAVRTGETIGATWGEIDLAGKVWTIPAERMKADREHRVPLSERAITILGDLKPSKAAASTFVFPGAVSGKPLSNMALLMLLRRMGRDDLTAHGFRSTFRDWAAERTSFQREVAEMALAHTIGDKVEAAYRRGDFFEKRRRLMDTWATCCATPSKKSNDNVTALQAAG